MIGNLRLTEQELEHLAGRGLGIDVYRDANIRRTIKQKAEEMLARIKKAQHKQILRERHEASHSADVKAGG